MSQPVRVRVVGVRKYENYQTIANRPARVSGRSGFAGTPESALPGLPNRLCRDSRIGSGVGRFDLAHQVAVQAADDLLDTDFQFTAAAISVANRFDAGVDLGLSQAVLLMGGPVAGDRFAERQHDVQGDVLIQGTAATGAADGGDLEVQLVGRDLQNIGFVIGDEAAEFFDGQFQGDAGDDRHGVRRVFG